MKNNLMCEQSTALASGREAVSFPTHADRWTEEGGEVTYRVPGGLPAVEKVNWRVNAEFRTARAQKQKPDFLDLGGML